MNLDCTDACNHGITDAGEIITDNYRPKSSLAKKYILYLVRWQLSTPILALCMFLLTAYTDELGAAIIANLIGGLIFFWIDKLIFERNN